MAHQSSLQRGGNSILLEKEPHVFTAVITNRQDIEKIKTIPGVQSVKAVDKKVCKVHVDENGVDAPMKQLRSEKLGGICHHAYRPVKSRGTRYYLTDEIIIKFDLMASDSEILALLSGHKLKILHQFHGTEKIYLIQVTSATKMNPLKIAARLSDDRIVIYAEPNLVNRFVQSYTPQDSYFHRQWHLKSTRAIDIAENADISATKAWDIEKGSRSVTIAILDDGFDLGHPDFKGEGKVVHQKDFVDGDAFPFPGNRDFHGTPCAGVAIAEENGLGVVGVAPGCAFMPVRIPFSANDNLLYHIFDYAGRYADVISCSWGPPPVEAPLPQLLKDKLRQLARSGGPRGKGCVILFAAGNYNAPIHAPQNSRFEWRDDSNRLKTTVGPIINGFAASPDVMAIAASTSLNQKAMYSNWGDEVAVCAPSDNFDPMNRHAGFAPGRGICTTDNESFGADYTEGSQFTEGFGGTSSATPLVAGVAGLVISANMELTARQVRDIITATADKITDFSTYWCGSGKVNAYQAVLKAGGNASAESGTVPSPRPATQKVVEMVKSSFIPIPDSTSPGIESIIEVTEDGALAEIEIQVDISHSYIGDLKVTLKSPDGSSVILHDNAGGSEKDLKRTFVENMDPQLRGLHNISIKGDWILAVEDRATNDIGTLNSWGVKLTLGNRS